MITLTSASDKTQFHINHKKIEIIKCINNVTHIILDTGKTYLVLDNIDNIKLKIIEFENKIYDFK